MGNLLEAGKRLLTDVKLEFMKNSSDYTFWGGMAGIAVGTVLACRATRKVDDILEEHKACMLELETAKGKMSEEAYQKYRKEFGKAHVRCWIETAGKFVKLYALPVTVELLSAGLLVKSHQDDKESKAQLAALAATLSTQVNDLRSGIKEKYGEEAEYDISHGIKEVEEVNEETGEVTTIKKWEHKTEQREYRFIFDASAYEWSKDPWQNLNTLHRKQRLWNTTLRERARGNGGRGWIMLYEVLKDMFPESILPKWTLRVGWIFDEQNPVGDNYIDFGIDDSTDEATRRFVKGLEPNVLMVFNCSDIYDLL